MNYIVDMSGLVLVATPTGISSVYELAGTRR